MRKVEVSHHVRRPREDGVGYASSKEIKGIATFHAFGVDYEEFDNGPGNYSTAIVEWPDGSVENVEVSLVRFLLEDPATRWETAEIAPCVECGKLLPNMPATKAEYLESAALAGADKYFLTCRCGRSVSGKTRALALSAWERGG